MPARPRSPQPTRRPVEHVFPIWGVDVFESHHADGWRMEPTAHDFLKVVFVLEGAGYYVRGESRTPCRRGHVVVVPIDTHHRLVDERGSPMSLYVVSIRPSVLDTAAFDPALLRAGVLDVGDSGARKIERAMRRLLFEQTLDQGTTGALMVAQALRLLVDLTRADAAPPQTPPIVDAPPRRRVRGGDSVARMRSYVEDLHEHFFEATNLDAAAGELGLSRRRFTQLFREVSGCSWLTYLRQLRVEHAKRLLGTTDRTVLSVAFECGFEDLSTFYRAFKRETGESPNKWRNSSASGRGGERSNSRDPGE